MVFSNCAQCDSRPSAMRPGLSASPSTTGLKDESCLGSLWPSHALETLLDGRRPSCPRSDFSPTRRSAISIGPTRFQVEQRLKSHEFHVLFTDLKGSTELYERVGDLVAYDWFARTSRS